MGYLGENLAVGTHSEHDDYISSSDTNFDAKFDTFYRSEAAVECDAAQFIDLTFVLEVE